MVTAITTAKPIFSQLIFMTILISTLIILNFFTYYMPKSEQVPRTNKIGEFEILPIEGAIGPESYVFDPLGEGPYVGLSDGRIIKWIQTQQRWIDFAFTSPNREGCDGPHDQDRTEHICGRPLGLGFNQSNGDLYIADAYKGLLVVGPEGGLATPILTSVQGMPLGFTNGLAIDQSNGAVYFTDSSSQYSRRNHISVILSGDNTGRLMRYDPEAKQVTVLLTNLSFPNGLELSQDGDSILLVETTKCRVLKYWLKTPKAWTFEAFGHPLEGFPDNIKKSPRGGYWVGLHSKKGWVLKWVLGVPWIGKVLVKVPLDLEKIHSVLGRGLSGGRGGGLGVRLSERGEVLEVFEVRNGNVLLKSVSEVMERDGKLWIGSIHFPFALTYNL